MNACEVAGDAENVGDAGDVAGGEGGRSFNLQSGS